MSLGMISGQPGVAAQVAGVPKKPAREIKERATRRLGELMALQAKTVGINGIESWRPPGLFSPQCGKMHIASGAIDVSWSLLLPSLMRRCRTRSNQRRPSPGRRFLCVQGLSSRLNQREKLHIALGGPCCIRGAMVPEGTSGKWSIWATHPRRLGGIAELYSTEASAAARAADLRHAGYLVEIFLSRPIRSQPADAA